MPEMTFDNIPLELLIVPEGEEKLVCSCGADIIGGDYYVYDDAAQEYMCIRCADDLVNYMQEELLDLENAINKIKKKWEEV